MDTETTIAAPSLLDAALRLSATMQRLPLGLAATADRIEAYDRVPYPLTYAFSSHHVAGFLRALDAARQAREDGLAVAEAEAPPPRPSYGPRLRGA